MSTHKLVTLLWKHPLCLQYPPKYMILLSTTADAYPATLNGGLPVVVHCFQLPVVKLSISTSYTSVSLCICETIFVTTAPNV